MSGAGSGKGSNIAGGISQWPLKRKKKENGKKKIEWLKTNP